MADREKKKDWRNSPLAWFIRLLWAQESGDQGRLQQALGWLKRLGYSIELTRKRRRVSTAGPDACEQVAKNVRHRTCEQLVKNAINFSTAGLEPLIFQGLSPSAL